MIHKTVKNWNKLLSICAVVFQLVFLLELVLFRDYVVVDPSVHHIGYEQWLEVLDAWKSESFYGRYGAALEVAVRTISMVFQILFDTGLIYLFVKSGRFCLSRWKMLAGYIAVALLAAASAWFIKYNVDFYRLYMYSIFTELLALYALILAGRARRGAE